MQSSYLRHRFTAACVNFKISSTFNNIHRRLFRVLHLYNWETPNFNWLYFRKFERKSEKLYNLKQIFFPGTNLLCISKANEFFSEAIRKKRTVQIRGCWQTRIEQKRFFQDSPSMSQKRIGEETWNHQFSASKWAKAVLSYIYKRETILRIFFHLFHHFINFKLYQVHDYFITSLTF
jgi:hypothetical protein